MSDETSCANPYCDRPVTVAVQIYGKTVAHTCEVVSEVSPKGPNGECDHLFKLGTEILGPGEWAIHCYGCNRTFRTLEDYQELFRTSR